MSTEAVPGTGTSRGYALVLAFVAGFNVMLLEMCGFRVLTTNFGSSVYTTGVLLSLIMVALSIGYYLGGRFSVRFRTPKFLLVLLLVTVGYVQLFDVILAKWILDFTFELRESLGKHELLVQILPTSIATLLLYGVPMVIMSQVSPYLIGLIAGTSAGSSTGKILSISTVGSILGTVGPSFFFIPNLGVPGSLWVFKLSLLLIAGYGLFVGHRSSAKVLAAASLLVVLFFVPSVSGAVDKDLVFEGETQYGHVQITRFNDNGDEGLIYTPSRVYTHSGHYTNNHTRRQYGTVVGASIMAYKAKTLLILGGALGSVASNLHALYPALQITEVEIDPTIIQLSQKYVPSMEGVKTVAEDARMFLTHDKNHYDAIYLDLFAGESIPTHCATQEFFQLLKARLTPDGFMFANTNMTDWSNYSNPGDKGRPFYPIEHIYSALYGSGFTQLFHSNMHYNGFLFAFQKPVSVTEFRNTMYEFMSNPNTVVGMKAELALNFISFVPISNDSARIRPFSDSWVPEHLLSLKNNFQQHYKYMTTTAMVEKTNRMTGLEGITRRIQEKADVLLKAKSANDRTPHCAAFVKWFDAQPKVDPTELGKYFEWWTYYMSDECQDISDWSTPGAKFIRALRLLDDANPKESLETLSAMVEKMRAS